MFLGCSFTVGIGLDLESTWPVNVANSLNLECLNLGQGGGAMDTAFRLGYYWIPILRPKIVFTLQPHDHRKEVLSTTHGSQLLLPNLCGVPSWHTFYEDWITEPSNVKLNFLKNDLALKAICDIHGSKYIAGDAGLCIGFGSYYDRARDLSHPGIGANRSAAEKILNLINAQ